MLDLTRAGGGLLLALSLGASLCLPGRADAQAITGRIIDAGTGAPVRDATIALLDAAGQTPARAVSDSAGTFTTAVPSGRFSLRITHVSYEPLTTEPLEFTRGEVVTLEIRLGARPIRMEPLVVTARTRTSIGAEQFYRRMQRQRSLGQGDFITRDDIEQTTTSDINALLTRHPQVRSTRTGPGGMTEMLVVESRGGGLCVPALWVDGMRVMRNELTDLRSWFHPDNIEGVEIYPNAAFAPPELVAGSNCGAIAIWSRQQRGNPFTLKRVMIAAIIAVTGFAMTQ